MIDLTAILIAFLSIALCVSIRLYPRNRFDAPHPSDTLFHLAVADEIRAKGLRLPNRIANIAINHEHTYPPGYHFALAVLSGSGSRRLEKWTAALSDAVILACGFLVLDHLMPQDTSRKWIGFLTLGITFSFHPALLKLGSGPRTFFGSPRPVGQALFAIYATFLLLWILQHSAAWLALSVLAGSILLCTSKFSIQVLFFFSAGFCSVLGHETLLPLLLSLLGALAISRGHVLRVLTGQILHSYFYVTVLQKIFLHPNRPRLVDEIRTMFASMNQLVKGNALHALSMWFSISHPLLFFLAFNFLFVFVIAFFFAGDHASFLQVALYTWTFAALFCFVVTKIKPLLFLGEGERYLEYAIIPTLALCSYVFSTSTLASAAISVIFLLYGSAALWTTTAHLRHSEERGLNECALQHQFQEMASTAPGLVWPIGSFQWLALYLTGMPILTFGCNYGGRYFKKDEFELIYGHYPYPSKEISKIASVYDVEYVITDTAHLEHYTRKILTRPDEFFSLFSLHCETSGILIYKRIRQ